MSSFASGRNLVVCSLGSDPRAQRFANEAPLLLKGALIASLPELARSGWRFDHLELDLLRKLLVQATKQQSERSQSVQSTVLLVLNSQSDDEDAKRQLEQIGDLDFPGNRCVLDLGFSAELRSFAAQRGLGYEPQADDELHMEWLNQTMTSLSESSEMPRTGSKPEGWVAVAR